MSQNISQLIFGKHLDELTGPDLISLKSKHEGWFHDYKKEMISTEKIGKHLCSFSNRFGGILYFGIDEDSSTLCAGSFPGIPTADVSGAIVKIRQAASDHCSPTPFFELQVINGSCQELNLQSDKSIIIVLVHEGRDTPYMHSSGLFYTRVHDSSEPIKITDRFSIDKLIQKGEETNKNIETFIEQNSPPLQSNSAHARIFIFGNPSMVPMRLQLTLDEFKAEFKEGDYQDAPLRSFQEVDRGYKTTQYTDPDNVEAIESISFWKNGNALLEVDLARGDGLNLHSGINNQPYQYTEDYNDAISNYSGFNLDVIDLNYLAVLIHHRLRFAVKLIGKMQPKIRELYVYMELHNVGNTSPYIDSDDFVDHIIQNGLPINRRPKIQIPLQIKQQEMIKVNLIDPIENKPITDLVGVAILFDHLSSSLGYSINDKKQSLLAIFRPLIAPNEDDDLAEDDVGNDDDNFLS